MEKNEMYKKYIRVKPETLKKKTKKKIDEYFSKYKEKEKIFGDTAMFGEIHFSDHIEIEDYNNLCEFLEIPKFTKHKNKEQEKQESILNEILLIEKDGKKYKLYGIRNKKEKTTDKLKTIVKTKKKTYQEGQNPSEELEVIVYKKEDLKDILPRSEIYSVDKESHRARNEMIDALVEYLFLKMVLLFASTTFNSNMTEKEVDPNRIFETIKNTKLTTNQIAVFVGFTTQRILNINKSFESIQKYAIDNSLNSNSLSVYLEKLGEQYRTRIERMIERLKKSNFITHEEIEYGIRAERTGNYSFEENDKLVEDMNISRIPLSPQERAIVRGIEVDAYFECIGMGDKPSDWKINHLQNLNKSKVTYLNIIHSKKELTEKYYNIKRRKLFDSELHILNTYIMNNFSFSPIILENYLKLIEKASTINEEDKKLLNSADENMRKVVNYLVNKNISDNIYNCIGNSNSDRYNSLTIERYEKVLKTLGQSQTKEEIELDEINEHVNNKQKTPPKELDISKRKKEESGK